MARKTYLVTGANGEIGHSLIATIRERFADAEIVTLDIADLDERVKQYKPKAVKGNILDGKLIDQIFAENDIHTVFHLASILSTKAEKNPELAHHINVDGTLNILHGAVEKAQQNDHDVKVIYPSSIAVYGLPSLEEKMKAGSIFENQYLAPITMYGCNKLYAENLGQYFAHHYRLIEGGNERKSKVDFRCVRFPGLVSAITMPTGGTTDYGPEMLHNAAKGLHYDCFVRPDSTLSFMAMPDAIKSLFLLENAPAENLHQSVYNVTSFSLSAEEFREEVVCYFPKADINYAPTPSRQMIVDSWPVDTNDSAAQRDWGWKPDFDCEQAFEEYLVPAIKERYKDLK